jgi:hypothetical protein
MNGAPLFISEDNFYHGLDVAFTLNSDRRHRVQQSMTIPTISCTLDVILFMWVIIESRISPCCSI